jgi:hypothetical protein
VNKDKETLRRIEGDDKMIVRSSTIDEISRYISLDKETLITKGIQSFLKEKKD